MRKKEHTLQEINISHQTGSSENHHRFKMDTLQGIMYISVSQEINSKHRKSSFPKWLLAALPSGDFPDIFRNKLSAIQVGGVSVAFWPFLKIKHRLLRLVNRDPYSGLLYPP